MKFTLLNQDCIEAMKTLPDQSIDMVLCDPPYGTTACKWDSVIPFDKMWEQLKRLIKPNGAIVLFGSEPFSSALRISNIKNYKYDWIWRKNLPTNFASVKYRPMGNHETISVFNKSYYNAQLVDSNITDRKLGGQNGRRNVSKSGGVYGNLKESTSIIELKNKVQPRTVIDNIKCVPRSKGTFHPTQKPVALMEYLVKTYTQEGEAVLDFTMGSGTTGVACANLNRDFVGVELDENYFQIAKNRIEKANSTLGDMF